MYNVDCFLPFTRWSLVYETSYIATLPDYDMKISTKNSWLTFKRLVSNKEKLFYFNTKITILRNNLNTRCLLTVTNVIYRLEN